MATSYQYCRLSSVDAIRILTLAQGSANDMIRCDIKEIRLSEAEDKFEAISYVWGTESMRARIECGGQEHYVTANLHAALRRLRCPDQARAIWIDAICINQKDVSERSHQVKQMGRIFKNATRVLCWLGPDHTNVAQACFAFIRRASKSMRDTGGQTWTLAKLIDDVSSVGKAEPAEWEMVGQLLDVDWFKRAWIVQESGLARECILLWGDHDVHLYQLLEVAGWLAFSRHAPRLVQSPTIVKLLSDVFTDIMCTYRNQPTWRDVTPSAKMVQDLHPHQRQRYVDLLFCARSLQATDQRDIIYSSLGSPLAYYDSGEVMVSADYAETLPALQLRAAHALLRSPREAAYVLLFVTHSSDNDLHEDEAIPSWVPRWETFRDDSARPIPLTCGYEYRQLPYRASRGCSSPFQPVLVSDKVLSVVGWRFDQLTWTSHPIRLRDLQPDVTQWSPIFRENNISILEATWTQLAKRWKHTPADLAAALSLVLARGRPKSPDHVQDLLAYCERLYADKANPFVSGSSCYPFPARETGRGDPSRAEWTIARAHDWRIALTSCGRLALVPLIARPGDWCCILQGVEVPIVIREKRPEQVGSRHQVVGETCCFGVMDGELLEPDAEERPDWQMLTLV